MQFPANLRCLTVVRQLDRTYQASLQTDGHATNSFTVAIAATADEAVREVLDRRAPAIAPPPY